MKFSTRDLFWFTIVASLLIVLVINLLAFRVSKQKTNVRHEQEKVKLVTQVVEAQAEAAAAKSEALKAHAASVEAKAEASEKNVRLVNLQYQLEHFKSLSTEAPKADNDD